MQERSSFFCQVFCSFLLLVTLLILFRNEAQAYSEVLPSFEWTRYSQDKAPVKLSYWLYDENKSKTPSFNEIPAFDEIRVTWASAQKTDATIRLCFQSRKGSSKYHPLELSITKGQGRVASEIKASRTEPESTRLLHLNSEQKDVTLTYNHLFWQLKSDCPVFTTGESNLTEVSVQTVKIVDAGLSKNSLWARDLEDGSQPELFASGGGGTGSEDKDDFDKRPGGGGGSRPVYEWFVDWVTVSVVEVPFGKKVHVVSPEVQLVSRGGGAPLVTGISHALWLQMVAGGHHLDPQLLQLLAANDGAPESIYNDFVIGRLSRLFNNSPREEISLSYKNMQEEFPGSELYRVEVLPSSVPKIVGCSGGRNEATQACNSLSGNQPQIVNPPPYSEIDNNKYRSPGRGGDERDGNDPSSTICTTAGCSNPRHGTRSTCRECTKKANNAEKQAMVKRPPAEQREYQQPQYPQIATQNVRISRLYQEYQRLGNRDLFQLLGGHTTINYQQLAIFMTGKINTRNVKQLQRLSAAMSFLYRDKDLKKFLSSVTRMAAEKVSVMPNSNLFNQFSSEFIREWLVEVNAHTERYFPRGNNVGLKSFLSHYLLTEQMVAKEGDVLKEQDILDAHGQILTKLFVPITELIQKTPIPVDAATLSYLNELSDKLNEKYKANNLSEDAFWGDEISEFENLTPDIKVTTFSQFDDHMHMSPTLFKKFFVSTLFLADQLKMIDKSRLGDREYQLLKQFIHEIRNTTSSMFDIDWELKIIISHYLLITCGIVNVDLLSDYEQLNQAVSNINIGGRSAEGSAARTFDASEELEKMISTISFHVSTDWMRLGRKLGIPQTTIEGIDADYRDTQERAYQVLLKWYHLEGFREGGKEQLKKALEGIDRKDIAETISLASARPSDFVDATRKLANHFKGPDSVDIGRRVASYWQLLAKNIQKFEQWDIENLAGHQWYQSPELKATTLLNMLSERGGTYIELVKALEKLGKLDVATVVAEISNR